MLVWREHWNPTSNHEEHRLGIQVLSPFEYDLMSEGRLTRGRGPRMLLSIVRFALQDKGISSENFQDLLGSENLARSSTLSDIKITLNSTMKVHDSGIFARKSQSAGVRTRIYGLG